MEIGVPKESAAGERRVALVPEVVRKLTAQGHEVVVERGAGAAAMIPDAGFEEAGATLAEDQGRCTGLMSWSRSRPRAPRRSRGSGRVASLSGSWRR